MWSGPRIRTLSAGFAGFSLDAAWFLPLVLGAIVGVFHLPFVLVWLLPIPLAVAFYQIARTETPRQAAAVGFWLGLGFWAVHLFWLPLSLSKIFGVWFLWPLIALVWPIEAAMWSGVAWLAHKFGGRVVPTLGVLACLFVALEWFRTWFPAPFPWGNFGYALVNTPFAQVASLGGVYGLSSLVAFLAAALAALFWQEWWPALFMLVLWVVALLFGLTRPNLNLATTTASDAVLVQGNIDPLQRATGKAKNELEVYRDLTLNALHHFKKPKLPVVVWPEASVNQAQILAVKLPRFVGGVWSFEPQRINAVAAVKDGVLLARTTKQREVPFGECVPLPSFLEFIYKPIYRSLGMGASSCGSGLPAQVLKMDKNFFGAFVCYDSIFPDVTRNLVRRGATVLLETTNDGWFGGGMGNEQHFLMDKLRAIETNRYLLRDANTGITALVDPYGRTLARLPENRAGTLAVQFEARTELTPYVRFGDWPLFVVFGLLLVFVARGARPQRLI